MADKKHIARVVENIEFADGKDRVIKPLTIKSLREFIAIIKDLEVGDEVSAETLEKMVDASYIVLHQTDKEVTKEEVEEIVDLDTFQKIMTVAMGNRLFDPNQAAAEA